MKIWWAVAFGIVCGLLAAGLLILVSGQPRGVTVQLLPPPTASPLFVHVTGAVIQPGVYPLPRTSRVQDALQAAGGYLPEADLAVLNLAAVVQDGERIWVPWKPNSTTPPPQQAESSQRGQTFNLPASPPTQSGLININSATQSELETLPGIGPVTAQKIIAYRQEHGPFTKIEELLEVSGIGVATLDKFKDYITIGGSP